ncbi:hypothetical protein BKA70DRAFT_825321 [Coprinopsis sp. MPI-PUGE-AT-0042]|nr:hypothetical protein BKA70DRAFT_825321 [Coprinopsis sp. MPI-PUGE-AT-0042]
MSDYKPPATEKDTYGTMIAASRFGGTILGSALYGIQVFMVLSTLSAFFGKSKWARKPHLPFIVISCVILVTFSGNFAIDTWRTFRVLFIGGPKPWSYSLAYSEDEGESWASIFAGDVFICVTIAVGDILLLWCCCAIWDDKKWVVLLPCLTCLGAIACYIAYLVLSVKLDAATKVTIKAAAASLSVAMNVAATLLILLRFSITRRLLSKAIPDRKNPRMYSDVARLLINAAAPLAIFGICFITTAFIDHSDGSEGLIPQGRIRALNEVFGRLYYSFCALSPQLIIYRVATARPWTQDTEESSVDFSQPVQFSRSFRKSYGNKMMSGAVREIPLVQVIT